MLDHINEALFKAVVEKNITQAIACLDAKADPNLFHEYGHSSASLLDVAVSQASFDITQLLLERGAESNRLTRGCAVLHMAVNKNLFDIVQLLLAHKAEINQLDNEQRSPLFYLTESSSFGPYPNTKKIAELLLEKGASANIIDTTGQKPIEYLMATADYEIIELLWSHTQELNKTRLLHLLPKRPGLLFTPLAQKLINDAVRRYDALVFCK